MGLKSIISTGGGGGSGGVINPSPPTTTVSGITIILTAGENLAFGDNVYIKSDGKVWKSNATTAALIPTVGMAAAAITANNTGNILLDGTATNSSWTWTIGGLLYASTTSGAMTQTQPSNTDNVIQVVGRALTATTVLFNPSPDYITYI